MKQKNKFLSMMLVFALVISAGVFSACSWLTTREDLTEVQANEIMATAETNFYTHNKIKQVDTVSMMGYNMTSTTILTETVAYSDNAEMGQIWVTKDAGVWYEFSVSEYEWEFDGVTTVEKSYTKEEITVPNDDARYYSSDDSEDVSGELTFVEAYTEDGITTIVYKTTSVDDMTMRITTTISNGNMTEVRVAYYDELSGEYDDMMVSTFEYDSSVTDIIPELPDPTLEDKEWELYEEIEW